MRRHIRTALILGVLGSTAAHAAPPPIPSLAQWEAQMIQYGTQHCALISDPAAPGNIRFNAIYYDAQRVFFQMADYTGDPKWLPCAQMAEVLYRDWYVFPNNGVVAGWMIFPHGLLMDVLKTGDPQSKDALLLLAKNAAYAGAGFALGALSNPQYSREVAYNLQSKILAQEVGATQTADMTRLAEEAFRHMDAWFVSKTAPYVRPFMVGLTSEALILYYEKTGDTRVRPIIQQAMDWLWDHTWLSLDGAFMYTDRQANDQTGGTTPAVDLNLLIAPAFAWLYKETGEPRYQERGDQIFAGAVTRGHQFLVYPKQFNQNYRWSFAYVTWRQQGSTRSSVGAPPAPPSSTPSSPPPSPPSLAPPSTTGEASVRTEEPRGLFKKTRRP